MGVIRLHCETVFRGCLAKDFINTESWLKLHSVFLTNIKLLSAQDDLTICLFPLVLYVVYVCTSAYPEIYAWAGFSDEQI